MSEGVHSGIGRFVWRLLLSLLVLLALILGGLRVALISLEGFRDDIAAMLSEQLQAQVSIGGIQGSLNGFMPAIELSELALDNQARSGDRLTLESLRLTLDPWSTLLTRAPRLSSLEVSGARFNIPENPTAGDHTEQPLSIGLFLDLLLVAQYVTVQDSSILLEQYQGKSLSEIAISAELRRHQSRRQFQISVLEPEGSRLQIQGAGVGDPRDPNDFAGELYGRLALTNFEPIADLLDLSLAGRGAIDFWYRAQPGTPVLRTQVQLQDLNWQRHDFASVLLDQANFSAQVERKNKSWVAHLQDVALTGVNGQSALIPRARVHRVGEQVELALTDLHVADLVSVILGMNAVGGDASEVISALAPNGKVASLALRTERISAPLERWYATADVQDISTSPFLGAPGLYGIDATIEASSSGAQAWIDTADFGLELPRVYRERISLERVRGKLAAHWDSDTLWLHDGVLRTRADNHAANINFAIQIPLNETAADALPLEMDLSVAIPAASTSVRHRYIPYTINPVLDQWLDESIGSGQIGMAAFVWRGPFEDYGGGNQTLQLGLGLYEGTLRFQADWPPIAELDASIRVDTNRISVWSERGVLTSINLEGVSVEGDADKLRSTLGVHARLAGQGDDVLAVLADSPLYQRAGGVIDDLSVAGHVTSLLNLDIDLADFSRDPLVEFSADLDALKLTSTTLDLSLDAVSGLLSYSSADGFGAEGLSAQLFGEKVAITIGDNASGMVDASVLDAHFATTVAAAPALSWLTAIAEQPVIAALPLTGKIPIEVSLAVGKDSHVAVRSDLLGTTIALPEPFGKQATVSTPLNLSFTVEQDAIWRFDWQQRLHALWQPSSAGASIALGDSPVLRVNSADLNKGGVWLRGALSRVDLRRWRSVFEPLGTGAEGEPIALPRQLHVDYLQVDEVIVDDAAWGTALFSVEPLSNSLSIGLNSNWLDADLLLPYAHERSTLSVAGIDLDALPVSAGVTDGYVSPPQLGQPVKVMISNLLYGDGNLGSISFVLSSDGESLRAADTRGTLAGVTLNSGSQLLWQPAAAEGYQTQLSLYAELGDVADTFTKLGIDPALSSKRGSVFGQLYWDGGPADFQAATLEGTVDLQLVDGSFLPLPKSASGFLRLTSVLNLAGLFDRANVTKLFNPGVTFNKAGGQFVFNRGLIDMPGFVVDGSGGRFEFASQVDWPTQTIDGELIVTLPLMDNIPWVAALAGGLPVAAGAYLVSKVFEDEVRSLSSGVYAVTGALAEPDVKFERVFDAKARKPSGTADGAQTDPNASDSG